MKKALVILLAAAMAILGACGTAAVSTPATSKTTTYKGAAKGNNGDIQVEVDMKDGAILDVRIAKHEETPGISDAAMTEIPKAIVANQSVSVDAIAGATVSSNAILEATKAALTEGKVDLAAFTKEVAAPEKAPTTFDKGWNAVPAEGITKGNYYFATGLFGRGAGHTGELKVVTDEAGKLLLVEFDEIGRPDYHTQEYQGKRKRLSEYNFMMGEIQGTAWIQGVLLAEQQMLEKQDLDYAVDYVAGATQTVEQGMQPLAHQVKENLAKGSNQKFYRIVEDLGGGLTGQLDVVLENGKIAACRYDELFADSPDKIEDAKLKKFYRTSKYQAIGYKEDSKIGFNYQMDRLNEQVIKTQDMLNLEGLPAVVTDEVSNKNPSWDNYLALAEKLLAQMKTDKAI